MRVALLQNFVAPYRIPLYEKLRDRLGALKIFISTPMESDRPWIPDWGTLDVEVQKNFTINQPVRDPSGFSRTLRIHFPYDTLPRLWSFRPDAVISVELGARSLQAAIYRVLRPSSRLVIWCKLSEHSERAWGGIRNRLRAWILRRADGVMVNGESGARYIARFGVPDSLIFRINQPIDVDRFTRVPRQRSDTARARMLCCGSLTERKGLVPFLRRLDLWARLHPEKALEIWWLGDGELGPVLERQSVSSNLTQHFVGAVPYDDLPSWYSQADILVFPTLLDEWGLVVNEAMAAGLPVLGSIYAQAVTELVADGVTGWIFDPTSDSNVTDALDRIWATPDDVLIDMRAMGKARIAGLTPETAAEKMLDALRGVLAKPWLSPAALPGEATASPLSGS